MSYLLSVPAIGHNGSGASSLRGVCKASYLALRAAAKELRMSRPNARDYPGASAYGEARALHAKIENDLAEMIRAFEVQNRQILKASGRGATIKAAFAPIAK